MEDLCVLAWEHVKQDYSALKEAFVEDPEPVLIEDGEQPALALMPVETFSIFYAALDFLIAKDFVQSFESWLEDSPQSLRVNSILKAINN